LTRVVHGFGSTVSIRPALLVTCVPKYGMLLPWVASRRVRPPFLASQAWSLGFLDRIRMGFRQHSASPLGVVDDVRALVWLVMATGHIEARQLPA
jgi:hypothetical protein